MFQEKMSKNLQKRGCVIQHFPTPNFKKRKRKGKEKKVTYLLFTLL